MKRNLELDIMKFLMSLSVAILHFNEDYFGNNKIFLRGGYLGVDFFFLVGGLLLAQHYAKHQTEEAPVTQANHYLFHKLKQIYPPYLFALLIMIVIKFFETGFSFDWLLHYLYDNKWQFFMLHFLSANVPYEMRSIWFLSTFIILSYFIYFLISYNKDLYVGLSPIICILSMVHIFVMYGSLSMQGIYEGWLSGGFIRGFAEMSLGVYLYESIMNYKSSEENFFKRFIASYGLIIKSCVFIFIFFLMNRYGFDQNDFFIFLMIVIYVSLVLLTEVKYKNKIISKCAIWLGNINYWIYLIHLIVSHLFVLFIPRSNYITILGIYLVVVILTSSLLYLLINKSKEIYFKYKT